MSARADKAASLEPWPRAIFAINLFVEDLAAAQRFYREIFGLTQVSEDSDPSLFQVGGTYIGLLKVEAAGELVEPTPVGRPNGGYGRHTRSKSMMSTPCAHSSSPAACIS